MSEVLERLPIDRRIALSAAEAGELVGVSEATVRRLVEDGHLARVKHTSRLLIARCELNRWVA